VPFRNSRLKEGDNQDLSWGPTNIRGHN